MSDLAVVANEASDVFHVRPTVLQFRTWRHRYAYDPYTGEILQLDELTDGILRRLGTPDLDPFLRDNAQQVGEEVVAKALHELVHLATKAAPAVFSGKGPDEIAYNLDYASYTRIVEHHLRQIVLVPTGACNLACYYCAYSGRYPGHSAHTPERMNELTLRSTLDYFVAHTDHIETPHIGFYGGEATLAFDAVKYTLDYLKGAMGERPFSLGLSTNFVDVPDEVMRFAAANGVTLYVSLDGPKHIHDRYRVRADGGPTFDAVMANLARLRAIDKEYYRQHVCLIATNAPPYRTQEMREFFETDDLVRDQLLILGSVNDPHVPFGDCEASFFSNDETRELREQYLKLVRTGHFNVPSKGNNFLNRLFDRDFLGIYRRKRFANGFPKTFFPSGLCVLGSRKLYVRWDGAFFPCERIPEYESFRLGSASEGFDTAKAFRLCEELAALTEGECRKCWAIALCSGICLRDCHTGTSSSREKKLRACEALKRRQADILVTMCEVLEENPRAFDFLNNYTVS